MLTVLCTVVTAAEALNFPHGAWHLQDVLVLRSASGRKGSTGKTHVFHLIAQRCNSILTSQVSTWKKGDNLYILQYIIIYIYIWSRFAVRYHPPPTWYGPKTCVLQHSAWKRCICSVFCMVGCWCGPQPCKFVGFLQPTFRKRVICNVSASTSWSSAAAPSSISVSNYHIILNLLLRVFSLGTGLISVYIFWYLLPVELSLRVSSFP